MIAPDLLTEGAEQPQLIGSQCADCLATTFPSQQWCPRCSGAGMETRLLPRRGVLVAFTTQGFVPKLPYAGSGSAKDFEPFGVGLVQLDDVVRIEARLTESDPARLAPGLEVELVTVPFYVDESGDEVLTFAFAPVAGSSS